MSKPKAQGTAWESDVVRIFEEAGFEAFRLAEGGQEDIGDVRLPDVDLVLECKDRSQISLHAEVQKANRKSWPSGWAAAVVWKRKERKAGNVKRTQVGDPIVALRLEDFVHLLRHVDLRISSTIDEWPGRQQ